jgi:hypothetical protein
MQDERDEEERSKLSQVGVPVDSGKACAMYEHLPQITKLK